MNFATWWDKHGSGIMPHPGEDMEEHAKRVGKYAWNAGHRDGYTAGAKAERETARDAAAEGITLDGSDSAPVRVTRTPEKYEQGGVCYDSHGNVDPNGAYDAGGNLHPARLVDSLPWLEGER